MQIVLYVGRARMNVRNRIEEEDLTYRFHAMDIRDLDGERLVASPHLSDNVIAILTRLGNEPGVVRRILEWIAEDPEAERAEALTELSVLAGLRRLDDQVEKEAKKLPIHESIMDFRSAYKAGNSAGPCRRPDGSSSEPDQEKIWRRVPSHS